jgi:hypothetical protein
LLVEHLARITHTADMDPGFFEILSPSWQAACELTGFVIVALARDSTRQIQHVEFGCGVPQQMREIPEAFNIS